MPKELIYHTPNKIDTSKPMSKSLAQILFEHYLERVSSVERREFISHALERYTDLHFLHCDRCGHISERGDFGMCPIDVCPKCYVRSCCVKANIGNYCCKVAFKKPESDEECTCSCCELPSVSDSDSSSDYYYYEY